MRLQKVKVLTGMTLSLLLSVVAVYPAAAQSTQDGSMPGGSKLMPGGAMPSGSMMVGQHIIQGTIRNINGEVVTIEMPNGQTQALTINQRDIGRLNLQPGVAIIASMNNGIPTVYLASDPNAPNPMDNMTAQQTVRGTIQSINGNVVTVQMPNGETQDITVTQDDMNRLSLQPGMKIVTTMNNGVASVNLANNTDMTTIRRTTTSTTTTPTYPVTQETTTVRTRRTTVARTTTRRPNYRPVRALW
ncbi:MAG: hypothetical protein NVS2B14_00850 [Chamaesiphon sp.]